MIHCIYGSCHLPQTSVSKLRAQCADYVRSHSTDFLPFTTDPKTGELFTEGMSEIATLASFKSVVIESYAPYSRGQKYLFLLSDQFAQYCSDIEGTAAWGGQLEVSVFSVCCCSV